MRRFPPVLVLVLCVAFLWSGGGIAEAEGQTVPDYVNATTPETLEQLKASIEALRDKPPRSNAQRHLDSLALEKARTESLMSEFSSSAPDALSVMVELEQHRVDVAEEMRFLQEKVSHCVMQRKFPARMVETMQSWCPTPHAVLRREKVIERCAGACQSLVACDA